MAFKKGVNPKTGELTEKVKEVILPKEEPRNMPVMVIETKEIKCIKKSEYNYLIHTCL